MSKVERSSILSTVLFYFLWLFSYLQRIVLYIVTRKHLLSRILSQSTSQVDITKQVEQYMNRSVSLRTIWSQRDGVDVDQLVTRISLIKRGLSVSEKQALSNSIAHIKQKELILRETAKLSAIQYNVQDRDSAANDVFVGKFERIWKQLRPGDTYERFGRQWGTIGFQGEDPGTDVRGLGLLGIMQLEFIVCDKTTNHGDARTLGKKLYDDSHDPEYFFAITGINLTGLVLRLLKDGTLDRDLFFDRAAGSDHLASRAHFSSLDGASHDSTLLSRDAHTGDVFPVSSRALHFVNEAYCVLFQLFHAAWKQANPENIMAFNAVLLAVEMRIRSAQSIFLLA